MGVRKWTASDIDAIMEIENKSFSDPWQETLFKPLLKKPYTAILYEQDSKPVGYAVLFDGIYDWELLNIAVDGEYKRKGIGKALLNECIKIAKGANADRLLLEVRPSNLSALNLYRAVGFLDDGVRKAYYNDGEDALLMSLNLN